MRRSAIPEKQRALVLGYQAEWVNDRSPVKVCVKSRRIGITWATAYEAVQVAMMDRRYGGQNVWYMTYSEEDAKEFISDVEMWARACGLAVSTEEEVIVDERAAEEYLLAAGQASVKITSIRFRSGYRVTCLPALPRKLRGKDGYFILDEANSFPNIEAALVAAQAFRMWGGRIAIISTMGDIDGEFCRLVRDISNPREGFEVRTSYSLHLTTLIDAVNDGLYLRICERTGEKWSKERQDAWLAEMLASEGADTEYLCQPRLPGGFGSIFNPVKWCEFVDAPPSYDPPTPSEPRVVRSVRAWDRAATRPHKANRDPDYTRGVLVQWTHNGGIYVVDGIGMRDSPGAVTEAIKAAAASDPKGTTVGLWQDPGAAGIYESEDMERELAGFDLHTERAGEAKHVYWKPVASAMRPASGQKHGQIKIVRGEWTDDFCMELARCPNGLHDDWADALALAYLIGGEKPVDFKITVPGRKRAAML